MARAARQTPDPVALLKALENHPEAFELFEALRRIECAYPESPRLGQSTRPADDPIRLGETPSLAFAPKEIDRLQSGSEGGKPRLKILSFGLFGPNAPLPSHLTEYALGRIHHAKDHTLAAFADIFHHRLISLFYRAWANAQPVVQRDRPDSDGFRLYMGALIGMATPGMAGRDALPDRFKRHFAGHFLTQARNAEGLQRLLQRFFQMPVRVLEFVSDWMRLPSDAYLQLGHSPQVSSLGQTTILGSWVWGAQQRFRLRVGPLSLQRFNSFLPGGESLGELVAAVKSYVGEEKSWDVQLVLKREDVPAMRLGKTGRLGQSTWMGTLQGGGDADQVILRPVE